MKPDDKFPEEMLDDIREAAVKARDAASDLSITITEMLLAYPRHPDRHEMLWWQAVSDDFKNHGYAIAGRAEDLADAEEETAEGGEE